MYPWFKSKQCRQFVLYSGRMGNDLTSSYSKAFRRYEHWKVPLTKPLTITKIGYKKMGASSKLLGSNPNLYNTYMGK